MAAEVETLGTLERRVLVSLPVADIESKVRTLRGAVEREDHEAIHTGTDALEALSWVARGALAAGQLDLAARVARIAVPNVPSPSSAYTFFRRFHAS